MNLVPTTNRPRRCGELNASCTLPAPWLVLVFLLMATSCDTMDADPPAVLRPLTSTEKAMVEAANDFGLDLFRAAASIAGEEAADENVVVSPLSVSMALGMVTGGAGGATLEVMNRVLGYADTSEPEREAAYRTLLDLLPHLDPLVRLDIANSLWIRDGFEVQDSFLTRTRRTFDATIEHLDFSDPASKDRINGWVQAATQGRIDAIVDQIPDEAVLYLINAVYFDGPWQTAFDPDKTRPADFFNADGSTSTVQMMEIESDFPVWFAEHDLLVDLPYGDSLFSMTLVFPNKDEPLSNARNRLTAALLAAADTAMAARTVTLNLPTFTVEFKAQLSKPLSSLGMGIAFSEQTADFSRINPVERLFVSRVLHRTFIQVSEAGTEAAAATAVEVGTTCVCGPLPVRLDRPFLYVIRQRDTGTILFAGQISRL